MRSDFSALDAELDALSPGATVDALELASAYSGELSAMSQIDAALNALGAGVESFEVSGAPALPTFDDIEELGLRPSMELIAPPHDFDESVHVRGNDDVDDEEQIDSGAFMRALSDDSQELNTQHDVVMLEEDILDADVEELVEITPEAPPLGNFTASSLFDLGAPTTMEGDRAASEAFAAIFEEATKRTMPPARQSTRPPRNDEPTARFAEGDTLHIGDSREGGTPIEAAFGGEDLDSAEFEIPGEPTIPRNRALSASSKPPSPDSQPPEKRPSFLGRLFGRKDE